MIVPTAMMNGMYGSALPYGFGGSGYNGMMGGGYGYGMAPVDPIAEKYTQQTGRTNPNIPWAGIHDSAREVVALEGESKGAQIGGVLGAVAAPVVLLLSPITAGAAPLLIAAIAGTGAGVLGGSQLGKWIGRAKFTMDDALDNGILDSSPRNRQVYDNYREIAQDYQKHNKSGTGAQANANKGQ